MLRSDMPRNRRLRQDVRAALERLKAGLSALERIVGRNYSWLADDSADAAAELELRSDPVRLRQLQEAVDQAIARAVKNKNDNFACFGDCFALIYHFNHMNMDGSP